MSIAERGLPPHRGSKPSPLRRAFYTYMPHLRRSAFASVYNSVPAVAHSGVDPKVATKLVCIHRLLYIGAWDKSVLAQLAGSCRGSKLCWFQEGGNRRQLLE